MNFLKRNYAVLLFAAACLLIVVAVGYAMAHTFGWYSLIFAAVAFWIAFVVSKGFINFVLN